MTKDIFSIIANDPKLLKRPSGTFYMQPVFLLPNGQKTKPKTFSSKKERENMARQDIQYQIRKFIEDGEHLQLGGQPNTVNPLFRSFYEKWHNDRFLDEYLTERGKDEAEYKIRYILQKLGNYPILDINHHILDEFYNTLRFFDVNTNKKRKKELSKETVRKYTSILLKIFDYAVTLGFLTNNPVRNYELARPNAQMLNTNNNNKKVDYFSKYETKVIINEAFKVNFQWGLLVFLALNTGMRRGELIALDINSSFDFDRNVIIIDKSIETSKNNRLAVGPTKNNMTREVYISNELRELIQKQIKLRDEFTETNKDTIKWHITYPLFLPETKNKQGEPYSPHGLSQKWKYFLEKVCEKHPDVRYYNLHILRHTFGTSLLNNLMPLELVSEALGHSSIRMTEKYYLHPSSERIKCMVDFLDFEIPEGSLEYSAK